VELGGFKHIHHPQAQSTPRYSYFTLTHNRISTQ
jgi:hypothetical protein